MSFDRSIKPKPSVEMPFSIPSVQTFKLSNGLDVYFVKKDDLPIVRLNLMVYCGSKYDPKGKKGVANLLAMMIDEGAAELSAMELSDEFDMLGSSFGIRCYNDLLYFSLQSIKENFEKSLSLFSKIITAPHLKEEDFEREKRKILIRLLQTKDDPEQIADETFEYLLFGKQNYYAYPVIGFEEDVAALRNKDVVDFYNCGFHSNNGKLIVVGNIGRDELEEKLEQSLKEWQPAKIVHPKFQHAKNGRSNVYFVHKESAVQSEIRIGNVTEHRNSPGYFPKKILNTILGGQFSSRINLNLREDKGWTYGAFSRNVYYKDEGYFYVSTSVGEENTANAVKEILYELNKIQEGVLPEELAFAQSSLIRNFPSSFETYSQIASNIKGAILHQLPDDYFKTYLDNIRSLTLNKVNETASNLDADKLKIVVVGDRKKVYSQLKKMNIGEIIETEAK